MPALCAVRHWPGCVAVAVRAGCELGASNASLWASMMFCVSCAECRSSCAGHAHFIEGVLDQRGAPLWAIGMGLWMFECLAIACCLCCGLLVWCGLGVAYGRLSRCIVVASLVDHWGGWVHCSIMPQSIPIVLIAAVLMSGFATSSAVGC